MHDDLHFVVEAIGKERSDRTVDQTAGEDFLFGRATFALEKAAGNATRCIKLLDIVDGQGKEVLTGLDRFGTDHGGQHHGVVHGDHHGATGLTGDFTGFHGQRVLTPLNGFLCNIEHLFFLYWVNDPRDRSAARFASMSDNVKTKMPAMNDGHRDDRPAGSTLFRPFPKAVVEGYCPGNRHYLRRPRRSISAL